MPTADHEVEAIEAAIRKLTPEQWEALCDRLNFCRHCLTIDKPRCQCWNDE